MLRQPYGFPILNPNLQYNDGIPEGSRLDIEKDAQFKRQIEWLQSSEGKQRIETIKKLTKFAQKGPSIDATTLRNECSFLSPLAWTELNCKVSHLALAWIARNPNTSTVILGASKPEQVLDNLKALEVIPKLTPEVLEKIEEILGNKPAPWVRF